MAQQDEFTFERLVKEVAAALGKIGAVLGNPSDNPLSIITLFRELGWRVPYDAPVNGTSFPLIDAANDLSQMAKQDGVDVLALLRATKAMLSLRGSFVGSLGLASGDMLKAMEAELPTQLLDHALMRFLQEDFPIVYGALSAAGIVVSRYRRADLPYRIGHIHRKVRWDVLVNSFSQPDRFFEHAYGWDTPNFDGVVLLDGIEDLMLQLGVPVGRDAVPPPGPRSVSLFAEPLRVPIVERSDLEIGVEIYVVDDGGENGIGIAPYVTGDATVNIPIGDALTLEVDAGAVIMRGLGFNITPAHGIEPYSESGFTALEGHADLRLLIHPVDGIGRIGRANGTRIELGTLGIALKAAVEAGDPTLGVEFQLGKLGIHLSSDGADSFLDKLLSRVKLDAIIDLTIGFASGRGAYVQGSGKVDIVIPVHESLGAISLQTVYISVGISDGSIPLAAAVSFGTELGPISVSVERMGVSAKFILGGGDGLALDDFEFGFLPPKGAGLALDAGGLTGGGYIEFDPDNERYAGILALAFGDIAITAISLITTNMPSGRKGFSMLINIGVVFDPAIQLSMGFTLNGVGGLVGVNRTMITDVLRDGLRNRTLDSILFPDADWVILNAPKVISDMRSVFPPADDRFIIGPMAKFGWGTPTLITADIGVFIEVPDPVRIVILGQIEASFPDDKLAIVELHVDVLGVIDFAAEKLSIDATIYDSRMVTYSLTGDMALRMSWGRHSDFAMSLGGFHPRFSPPPTFPELRRLSLQMASFPLVQITCEAYFALTPNSLQFGARVELYAGAGGASVEGWLYFDALFYFAPFGFDAAMSGGLQAKFRSFKLINISVYVRLSGTTPWHATIKATFKILFFDISIPIDKTWGRSESNRFPSVDPLRPLREALERPESWGAVLPRTQTTVETLRSMEAEPADVVVMHPSGTLEVRQQVLPLGVRIAKLGNSPVKNHNKFLIGKNVEVGNFDLGPTTPLFEYFARGQFEDLTEHKKLSLPSFERMQAGISVGAGAPVVSPDIQSLELGYESILIDANQLAERPVTTGKITYQLASRLLRGRGVFKASARAGGLGRFKTVGQAPLVSVQEEGHAIVSTSNMAPIDLDDIGDNDGTMTRIAADQALDSYLEAHPEKNADEVQVVCACEVVS